ncbi:hypothetical protein PsorP6_013786 [Peronosclerospora sorghi]|uniref:Uncharacterized protein n=1 Tax=Peronosclerospora sorghi TaxID=230839 RepID=A0ACC0VI78_9STRA|nr:hypothetical protein PsorP6_013786 [Peronosclerospora sorghi]
MFDAYNDRTVTEAVLWSFLVEHDAYRLGQTKVFFETGKIALLDAFLKVDMKKMGPRIVARLPQWLARRRLRYALAKVLGQRTFLRLLEDTRRRKAAIVKMQAMMRMFAIRKQFIRARNAHRLKFSNSTFCSSANGYVFAALGLVNAFCNDEAMGATRAYLLMSREMADARSHVPEAQRSLGLLMKSLVMDIAQLDSV